MAAPTTPSSLIHVTVSFTISAYCSTRNLTHPGDYSFSSSIQYGSSKNFQWTDTYNFSIDLVLVQETAFLDNNTIRPNLDTLAAGLTSESYYWNGKPTQDLSLSNLFWLGLYYSSNSGYTEDPLILSQYFNVTSSASSSLTASPSSTTSSSSSSSSTSSTAAAQPITTPAGTTTPASPAPSSTPKSTSTNLALGAGLGAGLGGTALILAVALFFLIGRKRQNNNGKPGRPEVYQLAENDTFSH